MATVRFRYQTLEFGDSDIHVRTLRDNQQYDDPDGLAEELGISSATWPLFGVLWASGQVLAQYMQDYDVAGLRILEVGCGIGLASLLLNLRMADISASDQHPRAEEFLQYNTRLNKGRMIPFFRGGWDDTGTECGRFDLIIGSDLLYEPHHAAALSGFIDQHAHASARAIIVDPGRGNTSSFCKKMQANGFSHQRYKTGSADLALLPFKGDVFSFSRRCLADGVEV